MVFHDILSIYVIVNGFIITLKFNLHTYWFVTRVEATSVGDYFEQALLPYLFQKPVSLQPTG